MKCRTLLSLDGLLENFSGDVVELFGTFWGDNSGEELRVTFWLFGEVGVLLVVVSHQDTDSLELLESVSKNFSSSWSMVLVGDSVVLYSTENVSQSADTDLWSEVDFSGKSGWVKLGLPTLM